MTDATAPTRRRTAALALVLAIGLGLAAVAWWRNTGGRKGGDAGDAPAGQTITPVIMGTTATLKVFGERDLLAPALADARERMDRVNQRMSTWNPDSELSRFNTDGQPALRLSQSTLEVLAFGQELSAKTGGAFDVTVLPLVRLWQASAKGGAEPTDEQIAATLADVGYTLIDLRQVGGETRPDGGPGLAVRGGKRLRPGVQITLDAIAKGYAVDEAVEAMKRKGATGGLVEIGGDLRCFATGPQRERFRVHVQSPWAQGERLMTLRMPAAGGDFAVCTSGNYRRYFEIAGRRYSHIIDPRTGRPADAVPSVTVIAPTCMSADGWATALSVLGVEEGLALVEQQEGVEAMMVTGTREAPQYHYSTGFKPFVQPD